MLAARLSLLWSVVNGITSVPYCPHEPTRQQRLFLALESFEALYGGQAGGGKSDALLMAALQHVDRPGYAALLLRRTFADLNKPGALMDRAAEWLRPTAARWQAQEHRWTFPIGASKDTASISFGYMDTEADRYQYQGAEYQYIGFDELTQFTETQYLYPASRIRRGANGSVPLRLRGATNPGGVGHAWVKARFIEPRSNERPFVPAAAKDNPHIDLVEYERALSVLDQTTHDQLAKGLWVQDASRRMYNYDTRHNVPGLPFVPTDPGGKLWQRVFVIDLGSSTKDPTTSQTRLTFHPHISDHVYVEFSFKKAGMDPDDIAEAAERETAECGGDLTVVLDEGALGHAYGNKMRSKHGIPCIPAEKSEKRANVRMLNGQMQRGYVHCIAERCGELLDEFDTVIYDKHGLDAEKGIPNHCTDGVLYGWRWTFAHEGRRPNAGPEPYSPEWWAQREKEAIEREIASIKAQNAADAFTRW